MADDSLAYSLSESAAAPVGNATPSAISPILSASPFAKKFENALQGEELEWAFRELHDDTANRCFINCWSAR